MGAAPTFHDNRISDRIEKLEGGCRTIAARLYVGVRDVLGPAGTTGKVYKLVPADDDDEDDDDDHN